MEYRRIRDDLSLSHVTMDYVYSVEVGIGEEVFIYKLNIEVGELLDFFPDHDFPREVKYLIVVARNLWKIKFERALSIAMEMAPEDLDPMEPLVQRPPSSR